MINREKPKHHPLIDDIEGISMGAEYVYVPSLQESKTIEEKDISNLYNDSGVLIDSLKLRETLNKEKDTNKALYALFRSYVPSSNSPSRRPVVKYSAESESSVMSFKGFFEKEVSVFAMRDSRFFTRMRELANHGIERSNKLGNMGKGESYRSFLQSEIINGVQLSQLVVAYTRGSVKVVESLQLLEREYADDKLRQIKNANIILIFNNGTVLDISKILPKDTSLLPVDLHGEFGRKTDNVTLQFYNPQNYEEFGDIKSRAHMTSFSINEANKEHKEVNYDPIKANASFLTLFHEIAHAWQFAHGLDCAQTKYKKVMSCINDILNSTACRASGISKMGLSSKIKELEELGVEFASSEIKIGNINNIKTGEKDEVIFKVNIEGDKGIAYTRFLLRGFHKIVEDYAREERDATAMALVAIRFLKKRGLDIEPRMSNSDLIEHSNNALRSYQNIIDLDLETQKTKFTKRK